MREIDTRAQTEMLQFIDEEKPALVVTHIHQGAQADDMEWPVGELIATANDEDVHSLSQLEKIVGDNKNGSVLLQCHSGMIGYFRVE